MSNQLQVSGEAKIRAIQGPVVANSGVITALNGNATQYVRGDGTLADFPTSTGGGSSVSYYLNTSVSQGTIGGVAYKQLSKTPISGAGTDVTISANGYVASYITDSNDPALLEVPAGNFNCEFYFSVDSNAHNPYVYAELYKYDGTTFTLLGSSQSVPEYLTNGTTLSPYYFAIPVATAVLTVTDRIAIRIYVNVDTRTVTLHTENNHLCQVVTTFSKGLISLNNLTRQNQFFQTGTSGTDFAISSATATHTFNLPVASATNTGKLSSTDWSTFNGKVPYTGATANVTLGAFDLSADDVTLSSNLASLTRDVVNSIGILRLQKGANGYIQPSTLSVDRTYTLPDATGTIALTSDLSSYVPYTGATASVNIGNNLLSSASIQLNGDNTSNFGYLGFKQYAGGSSGFNGYTSIFAQGTNSINIAFSATGGSKTISFLSDLISSSTTRSYSLPDADGTIALTSSLSSYLPLAGGTLTGALNGTSAVFSSTVQASAYRLTGMTGGSGALYWTSDRVTLANYNATGVVNIEANGGTSVATFGGATYNNDFVGTGRFTGIVTFGSTLSNGTYAYTLPSATGTLALGTGTTNYHAKWTGTNTIGNSLIWDNGTNVGIGNTNTSYTLDVTGTINATKTLTLRGQTDPTSGVGMELFYRTADTSSYLQSYDRTNSAWKDVRIYGNALYFGTQGNNSLTINTSGNVGIGTSVAPAVNGLGLAIYASDYPRITLRNSTSGDTTGDGLQIAMVGANVQYDLAESGYQMWTTGGTERMRITSGGNVLIGTITDSGFRVNVNQTSSTDCMNIASASPTTNATGLLRFASGTGSGTYLGDVRYNGTGVSYLTASDKRLKENIVDIESQLNKILSIKVRRYDFIDNKINAIGFIAQELFEIAPEAVAEGDYEDEIVKTWAIDNSKLIPALVKAIQEQQIQIQNLQEQINILAK